MEQHLEVVQGLLRRAAADDTTSADRSAPVSGLLDHDVALERRHLLVGHGHRWWPLRFDTRQNRLRSNVPGHGIDWARSSLRKDGQGGSQPRGGPRGARRACGRAPGAMNIEIDAILMLIKQLVCQFSFDSPK